MSAFNVIHDHCDGNALPAEETPASSLARDAFHKLCPGAHRAGNGSHAPLGRPRCGDGSNYSFLFSRPKERPPREKIVIEMSGGGACWDALTCAAHASGLVIPARLDVAGRSCAKFDAFLCSRTVGGVDFAAYNYVVIPYCTQDVHLGDAPGVAYGGKAGVVQHVGAHNVYRTLQWVFENFPNPSEIFLTGCSAGGTSLPVVYDLVNRHYGNPTSGEEAVKIDVISDSPVFLTPSHFLQNYLSNWNVGTIMEMIDFDFDAFRYEQSLPGEIVDHALRRSKPRDMYGMVTHDADAASISYYKLMSGAGLFGGDDAGDDAGARWWGAMSRSMARTADAHDNFRTFVAKGSQHCNAGLNVPLGVPGFEDWAAALLRAPALPSSALSAMIIMMMVIMVIMVIMIMRTRPWWRRWSTRPRSFPV